MKKWNIFKHQAYKLSTKTQRLEWTIETLWATYEKNEINFLIFFLIQWQNACLPHGRHCLILSSRKRSSIVPSGKQIHHQITRLNDPSRWCWPHGLWADGQKSIKSNAPRIRQKTWNVLLSALRVPTEEYLKMSFE